MIDTDKLDCLLVEEPVTKIDTDSPSPAVQTELDFASEVRKNLEHHIKLSEAAKEWLQNRFVNILADLGISIYKRDSVEDYKKKKQTKANNKKKFFRGGLTLSIIITFVGFIWFMEGMSDYVNDISMISLIIRGTVFIVGLISFIAIMVKIPQKLTWISTPLCSPVFSYDGDIPKNSLDKALAIMNAAQEQHIPVELSIEQLSNDPLFKAVVAGKAYYFDSWDEHGLT